MYSFSKLVYNASMQTAVHIYTRIKQSSHTQRKSCSGVSYHFLLQ